jgi:hypothetical protein
LIPISGTSANQVALAFLVYMENANMYLVNTPVSRTWESRIIDNAGNRRKKELDITENKKDEDLANKNHSRIIALHGIWGMPEAFSPRRAGRDVLEGPLGGDPSDIRHDWLDVFPTASVPHRLKILLV